MFLSKVMIFLWVENQALPCGGMGAPSLFFVPSLC